MLQKEQAGDCVIAADKTYHVLDFLTASIRAAGLHG